MVLDADDYPLEILRKIYLYSRNPATNSTSTTDFGLPPSMSGAQDLVDEEHRKGKTVSPPPIREGASPPSFPPSSPSSPCRPSSPFASSPFCSPYSSPLNQARLMASNSMESM